MENGSNNNGGFSLGKLFTGIAIVFVLLQVFCWVVSKLPLAVTKVLIYGTGILLIGLIIYAYAKAIIMGAF